MAAPSSLSTEGFCAALVSALIVNGVSTIRPRTGAARYGFDGVLQTLDKAIARASKQKDRDWLYDLLKLRTSLAPSTNGSYDSFEACLRGLQTSMVSSPNPSFTDLRFNVSKSYAQSSLERLDDRWAKLAKSAANEFLRLGDRSMISDERQHEVSRA